MGIRIHEIRKKYNLSSTQMNDLLSSIGYTGSTNAFAGLPNNIIEKIEKHFVTKSSFSDSERRLYTRLRLHEARNKYKLDSKQMNDLLSNLGYTGSTNAMAVLPYNIIEKIEKHFAAKSTLSDSNIIIPKTVNCSTKQEDINKKSIGTNTYSYEEIKNLLYEIEYFLASKYQATGNDFISKINSVKDILNQISPSFAYLMSNRIEKDYIYSTLIKIYNKYNQKNIKDGYEISDFIYELKLLKYFLSSEKLDLDDFFLNKSKWQNKSVFIKLSTSDEYGKDFLRFLSKTKNKTTIINGNDSIDFVGYTSFFDFKKENQYVDNDELIIFCELVKDLEEYFFKVKMIVYFNPINLSESKNNLEHYKGEKQSNKKDSNNNIKQDDFKKSDSDVDTYQNLIMGLKSLDISDEEKTKSKKRIQKGYLADLSAELEELLVDFGANGNGLGKKLQNVRNDLPNTLRKTISVFNKKRIKIHKTKEDFSLSFNEITEAIELANNAIIQLKELVRNGVKAGNTASYPNKQNKEEISIIKKEENGNNSENHRNYLDLKQTMDLYNTQNVVHSSSRSTTEVKHNTFCENLDECEQFRPIYKGEIVTGTVLDKDNRGVYVDLGYTSDGIIPYEEFEYGEIEKLNVGDSIKVYVKKIENKLGQVQLSYRRAQEQSSLDELEDAFKNKTPVEGILKERINGGYNVTVLGNRAFLPQSQLSHGKIVKENIGKPFQMIITEFNRKRKNIVVSERAIHEVIRNKKFDKYHVGDIIIGKVKKIVQYGVFVELEEDVKGLLHNSNISSYQKEILEEGQTVKVQILKIDSEKHRFSLGLEQNSYSDKKYEYAIDSDYKIIEMVDFLIDYMQWLNKKILIKDFPLIYCKGFRLSTKNFRIHYNHEYIYCSFNGLDKEKIKELNNIFNNFNDYYNKSINLYCVVQKGYVTGEDVSKNTIFFKLDKFTVNPSN